MARIRTIKPEFFLHEGITELSPLHRLLFIGLWCLADRKGRLEDRPKRIKIEILPWDDCDLNSLLQDLHDAGFILRYEAEGLKLIQVVSFEKHQRISGKEAQNGPVLPSPPNVTDEPEPEKHEGSTGEAPEKHPGAQERSTENGEQERRTENPPPTPPTGGEASGTTDQEADPVVLELPSKEGQVYRLRQSKVDEWAPLYPELDVGRELRLARAWLLEKPPHQRKTYQGMPRFLLNWLNSARERLQGKAKPPSEGEVVWPNLAELAAAQRAQREAEKRGTA